MGKQDYPDLRSAEHERERLGKLMRERRAADKDIPGIPRPQDEKRRESCRLSLVRFICTYRCGFGPDFDGALFADQIEQIQGIERAVLHGEDIAFAAMRGGGKTSEERAAVVWCSSYGHSDYTILVGATMDDSKDNLESIRYEFEQPDSLFSADFPELCVPVQALEGSSRRSVAQTCCGIQTHIAWGNDRLILPDCSVACPWQPEGSRTAIIECKTIGGAIRGRNFHGRRPKLVFLDDVENDASVNSETETTARRRRIENDIGGLGGHRQKLTRVYTGTIMDANSVTAEVTNPILRPQWNGHRYAYMKAFPTDKTAWEEYCAIRRDTISGGPVAARAYYEARRAQMDAGSVVAWPEGFRVEEFASAVEKYYGKMTDKGDEGLRFVACEWQNDPDMMLSATASQQLRQELIVERLNHLEQWRIPSDAVLVTGQVDVHGDQSALYWLVSWWRSGFGGGLLASGTWPPHGTIAQRYPGMSEETAQRTAMVDLERWLMGRTWKADDGRELLPVFGEDSGAGQHQQSVFWHCRQAKRRNWRPTKGENVKEKNFNDLHRTAKIRGEHWVMSPQASDDLKIAAYMYDANWWKGFARSRLQTPTADATSYTLWGNNPAIHGELARHWTAEESQALTVKTTGREYDQWLCKPNRPNHWWDCVVGCMVIASSCGLRFGAQARKASRSENPVEVIEV